MIRSVMFFSSLFDFLNQKCIQWVDETLGFSSSLFIPAKEFSDVGKRKNTIQNLIDKAGTYQHRRFSES